MAVYEEYIHKFRTRYVNNFAGKCLLMSSDVYIM